MEVSAPIKILEGDSKVIGVTIGTVPGAGECAIITSHSAVNIYSMDMKNVTATWTFPTNKQEHVSSPAYVVNEDGDFVACQGLKTVLQWNSSSPSIKSFTSSKTADSTLLLIPIGNYLLRVSSNNRCYILSNKLVELDHVDLPSANKVIKFDIKRTSSLSCVICFLLQKEDAYSVAVLQCNYSGSPTLKVLQAPIPIQSSSPFDMVYYPSSGMVYLVFNDLSLSQYHFRPDIETGNYKLLLQHSIPRLFLSAKQSIQSPVCLTTLGDRCLAYISTEKSKSCLHFLHADLMNEIVSLDLPGIPSSIVYHKTQLFVMIEGDLYLSSISLSSLSLKDMVRHGSDQVSHLGKRLHVNSQVISITESLNDIPMGIQTEEQLASLSNKESTFEKEEEAILKVPQKNFESKALDFINSRVSNNHSVISFSSEFLRAFVQRCILKKHKVLSTVLRALLKNRVDISVNENILQAILDAKDLVTLLFYLQFVSVIPERDLLKIWSYCLFVSSKTILQFAKEHEWELGDEADLRKRFIQVIGIRILRIPCNFNRLQQEMSQIPLDIVYNLALCLISLECDIGVPNADERAAWKKYAFTGKARYGTNLLNWIDCLLDANLLRIVIDMKSNPRFSELLAMLKTVVGENIEFCKFVTPLKGVINHLEQHLPLPASATPIYSIEKVEF